MLLTSKKDKNSLIKHNYVEYLEAFGQKLHNTVLWTITFEVFYAKLSAPKSEKTRGNIFNGGKCSNLSTSRSETTG